MDITPIIYGLVLTTFAGLSTTLGALAIFFAKEESPFVSLSMGFSAGVMIGVSMLELLPQSIKELDILGFDGLFVSGSFFILGMVAVAFIDMLIPHEYMHEHLSNVNNPTSDNKRFRGRNERFDSTKSVRWMYRRREERLNRMGRTGIFVAIGIAIHNLPEGFVTMTGSFHSMDLGLLLAIAIALHNIPEGLSVAIPIYISSGDKKRAFKISFLSGLAEPLGALLSIFVIVCLGFTSQEFIEASLAFVAGIMVFISFDELLPTAKENCAENGSNAHTVSIGIISGIIVIFFTLLLFR